MKCPKCRADNAETRKFCRECGTELVAVCSKCGFGNPPDDKFCAECGNSLIEQPPSLVRISPQSPPTSYPSAPPLPTAFAKGRYQVKEFLGEGGKKK